MEAPMFFTQRTKKKTEAKFEPKTQFQVTNQKCAQTANYIFIRALVNVINTPGKVFEFQNKQWQDGAPNLLFGSMFGHQSEYISPSFSSL
jgi:hypothetical protein